MKLTVQQQEIIDTYSKYPLVKIYALAGTGKTSLLIALAKANPQLKFIYIVFNRANKDEAKIKFPKNVRVVNTHGLAYASLIRYTDFNLNKIRNKDYKESEIAKLLGVNNKDAKTILMLFNKYLNSAFDEIKGKSKLISKVGELYEKMKNQEIDMTHNFYLKEFSLMLRKKLIKLDFDVLMMDESQDTNMVTLAVCNGIYAKNKIFVGDENQQIYSFRESVNALDKLRDPKEFCLTNTFRFPKYNADWANKVLALKGSKIFLESELEIDERFNLYKKDEEYCRKIENEHIERCYISRSNSMLISKMLELLHEKRPFKTIRPPNEIFSLIEEVFYLSEFQLDKIWQNKFLLSFKNIDELKNYANSVEDIEILSAISLADKLGNMVLTLKEYAMKYYNDYRVNPLLYRDFLTTAHTCKGLEWDYVCVMPSFKDFISLLVKAECETIADFRENIKKIDPSIVDEINLFYVAMTRAKKSMEVQDFNEFYLDLDDWEIDKLLFEYRKALQDYENGMTESFEFNPKVILGYEEENSLEMEDIIDKVNFGVSNVEVSSSGGVAFKNQSSSGNFMKAKTQEDIEKEKEKKMRQIQKHNEFVDYIKEIGSWSPLEKNGFKFEVNKSEIKDGSVVGVRIGNGIRVHPMKAKVIDENIELENNTKFKDSQLTIIDLIENVPENVIAKNCKKEKEKEDI